jgi:hypothetical protein
MKTMFLLSVISSGCASSIVCTTETRQSIDITAVDQNNTPVALDSVVVTRADGSDVEVLCSEFKPVNGCTTFSAGREEQGDFTITGIFQGLTDTQTTSVDFGVCHVNTQTVVLVFTP